jgi:hypothetical protein
VGGVGVTTVMDYFKILSLLSPEVTEEKNLILFDTLVQYWIQIRHIFVQSVCCFVFV